MNSDLLKIFTTVAETGSVSAAAKSLNYVQSNVTGRIQQLEYDLGTQLFHRKPRGVMLTKTGEKLFSHAKDILTRIQAAENDIKFMENGAGNIRISSTESNSAIRLSPLLSKIHQQYPQLNIELFTGHTEHVSDLVINHQADIGFISGQPHHPDLEVIYEMEEQMFMVEPVTDPIPDVIIAFKKGCTYRRMLEKWMNYSGHSDYRIMEFGSLETILGCVAAGMGRTLLPEKVIQKIPSNTIKLSKLPDELAHIPTCLIKRKDNTDTITQNLLPMILKNI